MYTEMTFDEAVAMMKSRSINGRSLLDGLEEVKYLMRTDEDAVSERERYAFRLVCREMRKLFV